MSFSANENGTQASLDTWYQSLRPLKVDLVGDFAGNDLFVIHGDALMLYCITEAKVDLTRDGFQILHAVHAVEAFLHKLSERGCNFHVVWFHDHGGFCIPKDVPTDLRSKYDLTRAILVNHLHQRQATDSDGCSDLTVCFEFAGLQDVRFEEYLLQNAIHFFLCLDGVAFSACPEESGTAYLSIAYHLNTRGYSIAFINEVQFVSSKIVASVVSPSSSWEQIPLLLPKPSEASNSEPSSPLYEAVQCEAQDWSPWEDGRPISAREMTSLSALCIMARAHEKETQSFSGWAAPFIMQLVLLRRLPLAQRSFDVVQIRDEVAMASFLSEFSTICVGILGCVSRELKWDLFDLLDGRLLRYISANKLQFPDCLLVEAQNFAKKIKQITGVDIDCSLPTSEAATTLVPPPIKEGSDPGVTTPKSPSGDGVLSFSHPVLDNYLGDIQLTPVPSPKEETFPKIFKELSHWHNARTSIDVKRLPRPRTQRELRSNQKWMATYIEYSASLTNASGKTIDPEIIVVPDDSDKKSKPAIQPKQTKSGSQGGNKKSKGKSNKERALDEAQALKAQKASGKVNDALMLWEKQCQVFESEPNLLKRYLKVTKYLNGLRSGPNSAIEAEVLLYACNVLACILTQTSRSGPANANISALIWAAIQDLSKFNLTPSAAKLFNSFAKALQFPAEVLKPSSVGRPLPYLSVFDGGEKLPSLSPGTIDVQLQHCGPFLERSFDSAPDPRVAFHPDLWQRKVLDAIDADKSLFVVAPTSAGKTFISFYAMKKVLKAGNDGVLVYVAPTKALVNQIAAEIQARFSKAYRHEGRSVWAIHTRDYRVNNPTGCQILVTVPHILQIMLMAPSNAEQPNSWSRRVKRIIFDEVHCLGQDDDGVIWEQLLLLAPCPIIALSATVGNPLEFKAWLEDSERTKGYELEMIVHSTRYSDLRKFIWQPPQEYVFTGLQPVERLPVPGLDGGSATGSKFFHVHPMASLVSRNRETMQDLSLEPRDCLLLWKSMAKNQTAEFPIDPSLSPHRAIPKIARKADVAEYETSLKNALHSWMINRKSPFEAVQKELRSQCSVSTLPIESLKNHALPLLTDLREQGALPAILFNYDRMNCEDIIFTILADLSKAEEEWKATSPDWKRKMSRFEKWKKDDAKKQLLKKESKTKAKGSRRDEDDVDAGRVDDDPSTWASFDPEAPLPQFSLANNSQYTNSELEETIWSLRWTGVDPRIIAALRRGIGVHHAGMNRKYRQVVEMLFRKGFLSVVVATGTLALGLNMPCKTVVFFGDSVFLTALNYRQAAGRAGRRGFDLLGNVVFAGISRDRVYEIMSSRLPDLRGQFPMSTTLVLRTLGLLHHTKNSEYSVRAVQQLLSQTRLYLGGPADQMSIKHHVRFSIDYLRRQHLLSESGEPLNFAGLIGHLYYTENAVFAFHSLLKGGYFHNLCAELRSDPVYVLREVVLVLAHIFCRVSTRDFRGEWREAVSRSPSVVFLPALPEGALKILQRHNQDTLDIFKNYASTFVEQHLSNQPDRHLPFTKFEAGASQDDGLREAALDSVLRDGHLPGTKLRSPFDALSGLDDSFTSIQELCDTVRSGIFLEPSAVPAISIYPDDNKDLAWNAYLYDFFNHGDMTALVRDNRIKRGDVWFYLKDFSMVLATIVTSLTNFMNLEEGDGDMAMMEVQDAEDAFQAHLDDAEVDEGTDDKSSSVGKRVDEPLAAAGLPKRPRKKKVADSWDDESSEGDSTAGDLEGVQEPSTSVNGDGDGDGDKSLVQVLRMFSMVREQFDEKFKKTWS